MVEQSASRIEPTSVALNHSDKAMPVMGFGTAYIKEVGPIESAIVEVGYRHIDTASRYENEVEVGEAVQKAIAAGVVTREDMFEFKVVKWMGYVYHDETTRQALPGSRAGSSRLTRETSNGVC